MHKILKYSPTKRGRMGEPYNVIPKRQRLKTYKAVLDKLKDAPENALCVLLVKEVGLDFMHSTDTDLLFPEFGECIVIYQPTRFKELLTEKGNITYKWRVAVLKYCIERCNTSR